MTNWGGCERKRHNLFEGHIVAFTCSNGEKQQINSGQLMSGPRF
jgi:hypothetical protein